MAIARLVSPYNIISIISETTICLVYNVCFKQIKIKIQNQIVCFLMKKVNLNCFLTGDLAMIGKLINKSLLY